VTPPELIADINQNLTAMAADADSMQVDRRREALLRDLVSYTAPLAEHMDELRGHDTTRKGLVDAVLITQDQLQQRRTVKMAELGHARERETETENAASDANAAYLKTASIELLSRLQLAQLLQADAGARADSHKNALLESEEQAKICDAAALVSQEHAQRTRINDVEQMLDTKTQDAEPDRLTASSAAQAWIARLRTEIETLTGQHQTAEGDVTKAQDEEDTRIQELLDAERDIAKTETSIDNSRKELGQINELLKEARERGDLLADQSVPEALEAASGQAAALEEKAKQATGRRKVCQQQLDGLGEEISRFEAQAALVESRLQSAQADLDQVTKASSDLRGALRESQLLDLDPIHLDDHAGMISETLKAVAESAGRRQLDARVKAAAAQREVQSLETSGLLPARPDVSTLCELAAKYGARPGWTSLDE
jgi:chromosome segregation ATPase